MIIDSDYRVGDPQADGRCYISEVHRDKNGKTYEFEYLANPQSLDPQVVMKIEAVYDSVLYGNDLNLREEGKFVVSNLVAK